MIKIQPVLRIIGFLLIFLGAVLIIPLIFSLVYQEADSISFLITIILSLIVGTSLVLLFRNRDDIRYKEGYAIVTFGWIVLTIFASLPYIITGVVDSYTDAFFETMSGFTTTGASIFTDIEVLPNGILLWRSMTNWLGGMGIIMLSLAILPFLGVGGMQLFKAEVTGPLTDKLKPRIKETAKILWTVYVTISALEVIILQFAGMSLFDALCHSFATMATGGFSTKNQSIAYFNSPIIEFIIIFFMVIAGTNFSLHYRFIKGDLLSYFKNSEFRFFCYIMFIAFLAIFINNLIVQDYDIFDNFRFVLFQVVSLMTTTGFGTADYESWHLSTNVILLILMFIGGSAGSTAGGLKVLRVIIIIKFIFQELTKLIHPNAVITLKIGDIVIEKSIVSNILAFFIAYLLLAILGIVAMSLLGLDIWSSIGCVATTMGNIGPGFGMVGPTQNYATIPDLGKWILSFLMLVGRLEVFTVIILLAPSFWKK